MTADASYSGMEGSSNTVLISSSAYFFGNYEFVRKKPAEIKAEFICMLLMVDQREVNLQLSFKHITRVEFLDGTDKQGAGLVFYVNSFMAQRIEKLFKLEARNFSNYTTGCLKQSFILFDILNCDPGTMQRLSQVLRKAEIFHRNYILSRYKESNTSATNILPAEYLAKLTPRYWKNILYSVHRDLYLEEVTVISEDTNEELSYFVGSVMKPAKTSCSLQPDGSLVTRRIPDRLMLKSRDSYGGPPAKIQRLVPIRATIAGNAIQIEDRHSEHKAVAVYAPEKGVALTINDVDVSTLEAEEMLNDTIILFYMNFILHELMTDENRHKVHIFNSFFYSKLTNAPVINAQSATQIAKLRNRKITENYSTLRTWTKNVNLFEKDFIVVPINENAHWYLAIIMSPRLGLVPGGDAKKSGSETTAIPIWIFDSLYDTDDVQKYTVVADALSEYLALEYRDKKSDKKLPGVALRKTTQLYIPTNTPQQQNFYDCGIYMLQFAEDFLTKLPSISELSDTVDYVEMFGKCDITDKRKSIKEAILKLPAPKPS